MLLELSSLFGITDDNKYKIGNQGAYMRITFQFYAFYWTCYFLTAELKRSWYSCILESLWKTLLSSHIKSHFECFRNLNHVRKLIISIHELLHYFTEHETLSRFCIYQSLVDFITLCSSFLYVRIWKGINVDLFKKRCL